MSEWTGERLETSILNNTTVEHLHRYAIAKDLAKGKSVLDIACGEGYGSNLLALDAHSVTGVDIDAETISKARTKYVASNLNFIQGNLESIPCGDKTFDLVVSFETLEHIEGHEKMLSEIKRVMKPDGIIIISTPCKLYYSEQRNYKNKFHVKELQKEEFQLLMNNYFKHVVYFEQRYGSSLIVPSNGIRRINIYSGNYSGIERTDYNPHYIMAIASNCEVGTIGLSIFDGSDIIDEAAGKAAESVKNTVTYRTGHFLLYPLKKIRSLFKQFDAYF